MSIKKQITLLLSSGIFLGIYSSQISLNSSYSATSSSSSGSTSATAQNTNETDIALYLTQAVKNRELATCQAYAHACLELFAYFLRRSKTQKNDTCKNQDLWQALLALEKAQKIGDPLAQKIYAELTKRSNCYPSATISISEAILLLDLSQEIRSKA